MTLFAKITSIKLQANSSQNKMLWLKNVWEWDQFWMMKKSSFPKKAKVVEKISSRFLKSEIRLDLPKIANSIPSNLTKLWTPKQTKRRFLNFFKSPIWSQKLSGVPTRWSAVLARILPAKLTQWKDASIQKLKSKFTMIWTLPMRGLR